LISQLRNKQESSSLARWNSLKSFRNLSGCFRRPDAKDKKTFLDTLLARSLSPLRVGVWGSSLILTIALVGFLELKPRYIGTSGSKKVKHFSKLIFSAVTWYFDQGLDKFGANKNYANRTLRRVVIADFLERQRICIDNHYT